MMVIKEKNKSKIYPESFRFPRTYFPCFLTDKEDIKIPRLLQFAIRFPNLASPLYFQRFSRISDDCNSIFIAPHAFICLLSRLAKFHDVFFFRGRNLVRLILFSK